MPDRADLDFDPITLDEIRAIGGASGASLVAEIVGVFLMDAPKRFAAIQAAAAGDSAEILHRAAHTLKGSAGNVGLMRLFRACAALDRHARERGLAGLEPLLHEVEAAYADGLPRLRLAAGL